jgi:glycosyltransferase involved in cell wall biosynthesis
MRGDENSLEETAEVGGRMGHRVSVIIPVKNEEDNIEGLLLALEGQSYEPAEIVITDGGSTDRTRELICRKQAQSGIPIVLVETEEALPGRGRNLAIRRAVNEWVACIDAGIVPHEDWLLELVRASEREPAARIVYGIYRPVIDSYFKECAAIAYVPPPGAITPTTASCLLQRSVWEEAGGFREDLRSAEDLLFFRRLRERDVRGVNNPRAVVDWQLQPSLGKTFRRFAVYSRCGMKAGLGSEWQLSVSRFYFVMLLLMLAALWHWAFLLSPVVILLLRAARRIFYWYRRESFARRLKELFSPPRLFMVALITFVIDVAMFYGIYQWLKRDYNAGKSHADALTP